MEYLESERGTPGMNRELASGVRNQISINNYALLHSHRHEVSSIVNQDFRPGHQAEANRKLVPKPSAIRQ